MPITQSLTAPAKAESLGAVTQFVREGALEADVPQSRFDELDLLVEEIFMNIVRYAYPKGERGVVRVTYRTPATGELAVEFGDQGVEFNPLAAGEPDLAPDLNERRAGGLGVFLVKEFADSLSYRREQGWNLLTFGISAKP